MDVSSELVEQTRVAGSMPGSDLTEHDPLLRALVDSRQRWRDLATLAADLVFETDADGRFVFVAPDTAIGWSAATLLGQPTELLLADPGEARPFNPFRPRAPVRRRRAWLRRPDGTTACLSFAAAPMFDAAGHVIGARGIGQDVTEQDGIDAAVTATLRRGEVIDQILWCMRKEVLAPRMMQAVLDAITQATGAEGCAVIDLIGDGVKSDVCHHAGFGLAAVLPLGYRLLEQTTQEPRTADDHDGRRALVCPSQTRFGAIAGLLIWRAPGGRSWDQDEIRLVEATTSIVRVVLEHDAIQREMARQARTDPLTGLLNRRAFLDELARRFDRLERDGLPGTLMFVDLDHFKQLNDRLGHDVGDDALCITASLLRATVRPADLVARFGGDEFALWLDGADELSTAERAETLRVEGPQALAHLGEPGGVVVTMSIGIATRWPGRGEDVDGLINRADQVMYEVKRAGRGHWRVARSGPDPCGAT